MLTRTRNSSGCPESFLTTNWNRTLGQWRVCHHLFSLYLWKPNIGTEKPKSGEVIDKIQRHVGVKLE